MAISFHRGMLRRSARIAIAGTAILMAVHGASANDDAGVHGFFSAIFGSSRSEPTAAPAPVSAPLERYVPHIRALQHFHVRPLTVRLHKATPKVMVAQMPTKPGPVSIYEDHTLKRGDAVMTPDGIRVFAGSASWPYTKTDFIELAAAKDLNKDTSKVLAEVNRLPRG